MESFSLFKRIQDFLRPAQSPAPVTLQDDVSERDRSTPATRHDRDYPAGSVISLLPDLLFEINSEGTFINCYSCDRAKLLMPPEQFIGKKVSDVLPRKIADITRKNMARSLARKEMVQYEYTLKMADGEHIYEARLVPKGDANILAIVRDITVEYHVRQELQAAKDFAENLMYNVNTMIVGLDVKGNLTIFNRAAEEITGYSWADLEGKNWFEVLVPGDRYPEVWEEFSRLIKGGMPVKYENPILTKDGEERFIVWRNSSLQNENGIYGSLSFGIDITERKMAEEKIREALEEKETLLRELYHRTKNNMSVVCSMLDLQAQDYDDPNLRRAFNEVENRIHAMALVHQKLYQSNNLSSIDLGDYAAELVDMLLKNYSVGRIIEADIDFSPGISVLIDVAIPCGLLLNELFVNALIHAFNDRPGGKIRASIRRDDDGFIVIEVSDNGPGFPHGFDFRKDGRMGLRTVFALAELQLKGTVSFASSGGLTCVVRFNESIYRRRV
ncbi:MAG TPA: PAS domain S-box protein [Spirochaetota bacterium]|nr:PAS domain S-box protein [Spirochaetota bacterium]HPI90644.1 PAS domain S-box protein [Spirochaetota bacterium]HPR49186.1 PAS domain S-box protein [Spirochaetota bacterium]